MLYHIRCNNLVGLKGGIEVISQVGIDSAKKSLTTSGYIVVQVKKKVDKTLFCADCMIEVKPEDVYVNCAACGDRLSPENAYVIQGAGAILCPSHVKKYSKTDTTYLLSEILKEYLVKEK